MGTSDTHAQVEVDEGQTGAGGLGERVTINTLCLFNPTSLTQSPMSFRLFTFPVNFIQGVFFTSRDTKTEPNLN